MGQGTLRTLKSRLLGGSIYWYLQCLEGKKLRSAINVLMNYIFVRYHQGKSEDQFLGCPREILIPKGVLLAELALFVRWDEIKASLRRNKNTKPSQLILTKRYLSLLWRLVSWKKPADAWDSSGGKLHEIKKIISSQRELVLAGAGVKTWPQAALTSCSDDPVANTCTW